MIHPQGLLQRFDLQPSIIELRGHEFEGHRFPIVGQHLQQLEPVIYVQVLRRFILVHLQTRIALVGTQKQLPTGVRCHIDAQGANAPFGRNTLRQALAAHSNLNPTQLKSDRLLGLRREACPFLGN